jgi:hypothetical protein
MQNHLSRKLLDEASQHLEYKKRIGHGSFEQGWGSSEQEYHSTGKYVIGSFPFIPNIL